MWQVKAIQFAVGVCLKFVHEHFLWLLIGAYALAAFVPAVGLGIRDVSLGEGAVGQHRMVVSLPVLMLAVLLFNAGLGVKVTQLGNLARKPHVLLVGLIGNLVVPIGFIFCIAHLISHWHDPEEVQVIIVGLALVAAMPIAGSSTAWSQNANGDMALSLGLMLLSTFLSPLTTPFTFRMIEQLTFEEYAEVLFGLGTHGTGFLFWVVIRLAVAILARL